MQYRSLWRILWWSTLSKAAMKSICKILAVCLHPPRYVAVYEKHTKVHRRCPTIPVSKLGGWKKTTAFHQSSKTNLCQVLKRFWIRQYRCYTTIQVLSFVIHHTQYIFISCIHDTQYLCLISTIQNIKLCMSGFQQAMDPLPQIIIMRNFISA